MPAPAYRSVSSPATARAVHDGGGCPRPRREQVSEHAGAVDADRRRLVRSRQAVGPRPAGAAHARVPDHPRRHHCRSAPTAGSGNNPTLTCIPPGMPRAMIVVRDHGHHHHAGDHLHPDRVDQRAAPHLHRRAQVAGEDRRRPSSATRSAKWDDTDGDGRFDTLWSRPAASRGRAHSTARGIPLHRDNQTVVKERIYLDKADPNVLRNEITMIDNALTRPWTVTRRIPARAGSDLVRVSCTEGNKQVLIGKENYLRQRRRLPDAGQEGPAAAGPEDISISREVTDGRRQTEHEGGPRARHGGKSMRCLIGAALPRLPC